MINYTPYRYVVIRVNTTLERYEIVTQEWTLSRAEYMRNTHGGIILDMLLYQIGIVPTFI